MYIVLIVNAQMHIDSGVISQGNALLLNLSELDITVELDVVYELKQQVLNGWISKSFGGKPNPSEVKQEPQKRRGSHDIPVFTEEGKILLSKMQKTWLIISVVLL